MQLLAVPWKDVYHKDLPPLSSSPSQSRNAPHTGHPTNCPGPPPPVHDPPAQAQGHGPLYQGLHSLQLLQDESGEELAWVSVLF